MLDVLKVLRLLAIFDHLCRYACSSLGPEICTVAFESPREEQASPSIASCSFLGRSNLVHLRYSFLELLVLTFLVAMSFILNARQRL
jgi:hypothetical protein